MSGTISHDSGGVFADYGVWELVGSGIGWTGLDPIYNYGTVLRNGSGIARIFNRTSSFEFVSFGDVVVESGTLALDTVGEIRGTCSIAPGATVRIRPWALMTPDGMRFTHDVTIAGGGLLEAGWVNFEGGLALEGTLRTVGPVSVGGTAIVNSVQLANRDHELVFLGSLWCDQLTADGGYVRFEGETSIGRVLWSGCRVSGGGDITFRESMTRLDSIGISLWWTGRVRIAEGATGERAPISSNTTSKWPAISRSPARDCAP